MYLNEKVKKIIKEKIYNEIKPKQIILFGSYAYGTATEDSDIDLIIVEQKILGSKVKEAVKIKKILSEVDMPKDILVVTEDEFEFYKTEAGSVIRDAYERGEVL
jgi:predicted nucleotidyltransferase